MQLSVAFTFLLFILSATCIQLENPRVDHVARNVLNEFEGNLDYERTNSEVSTTPKRQPAPYWYETIAHQGISAFGPSGYQVYRNVKDFGATGKH
jgi:glucan 1,3-beta-glucosidase